MEMIVEKDLLLNETNKIKLGLLRNISALLPFAASAARQQVYLFTKRENHQIHIINAAFYRNEPLLIKENTLNAKELPLWDDLLSKGRALKGLQSFKSGVADTALFPIVDNGGKVIAGLAFISIHDAISDAEKAYFLAETACMAMLVPQQEEELAQALYKPLSYQDSVIIFNDEGVILYANEMATKLINLLGFDRRLVGASVYGGTLKLSLVKQAIEKHQGHITEEIYGDIVLEQILIPVISGGKTKRNFLILKDRTEKRKQEQELLVKNSVIKEIHHRVKNNLQSVAGLLRLQARQVNSEEAKQALQESVNRIESMALVHEIISHYDEEYLSLRTVAEELLRLLRISMLTSAELEMLVTEYVGEDIIITSNQATYLSLILNELVSNSIEHGFKSRVESAENGDGQFSISLAKGNKEQGVKVNDTKEKDKVVISAFPLADSQVKLVVSDTGKGFSETFNLQESRSLGLQIIRNLVENELKGSITIANNETRGARVEIIFQRED